MLQDTLSTLQQKSSVMKARTIFVLVGKESKT